MEDQDIFAFDTDGLSEINQTQTQKTLESDVLSKDLDSLTLPNKNQSSAKSQELADWILTLPGVRHALVCNDDGSARAHTKGASNDMLGTTAIMLTMGTSLGKALPLSSPLGMELVMEEDVKIIAIKLKSGFLCAITNDQTGLYDLIKGVKSRTGKGMK